jgi:hypothetical protein
MDPFYGGSMEIPIQNDSPFSVRNSFEGAQLLKTRLINPCNLSSDPLRSMHNNSITALKFEFKLESLSSIRFLG